MMLFFIVVLFESLVDDLQEKDKHGQADTEAKDDEGARHVDQFQTFLTS